MAPDLQPQSTRPSPSPSHAQKLPAAANGFFGKNSYTR